MTWLLIIFFLIAWVYIENKITRLKEEVEEKDGIGFTQSLTFDIRQAVLNHQAILNESGVKSAISGKKYSEWSESDKSKFEKFFKNKNMNIDYKDTNFNLTYLSNDDAFYIQNAKSSYLLLRRSPGKTFLFDSSLVVIPHEKIEGLNDDKIRLSVVLRQIGDLQNGFYHVVSAGLKEFNKDLEIEMKYHHIFDFPISKNFGRVNLDDDDFKKFGFKIERPTPWYDKDEFGELDSTPWDTSVTYKHKSGVEITHNM